MAIPRTQGCARACNPGGKWSTPKRWSSPRVATVAYRLSPEENPAPSARPSVSMGFMRDHHSRREIVQTGSNFRMHGAEFPFDPLVKPSDSVDRAVFHVWAELPLLSVGLHRAGPGDRALRAAPAGELLVLHYFLRRLPGGNRLYRGGSAAGLGTSSRRVSGVWATVTHTKGRNRYSGQSLGGKLRRTGRTLQRSRAIREGARRVQPCDHRAKRFDLHVLFAGAIIAGIG